jgi:hypothetical protein
VFLCNDTPKIKMAFYLVKAKPRKELLESLHGELNSGKISKMRPFGSLFNTALKMPELIQKIALLHYGQRKTIIRHH